MSDDPGVALRQPTAIDNSLTGTLPVSANKLLA